RQDRQPPRSPDPGTRTLRRTPPGSTTRCGDRHALTTLDHQWRQWTDPAGDRVWAREKPGHPGVIEAFADKPRERFSVAVGTARIAHGSTATPPSAPRARRSSTGATVRRISITAAAAADLSRSRLLDGCERGGAILARQVGSTIVVDRLVAAGQDNQPD